MLLNSEQLRSSIGTLSHKLVCCSLEDGLFTHLWVTFGPNGREQLATALFCLAQGAEISGRIPLNSIGKQ